VGKTYPVPQNKEFKAIIVRCPDGRFALAHKMFIDEELCLAGGQFVSLKSAGGAGGLARPEEMANEFWSLHGQIDMFVKHHPSIGIIVIFTHEDCRRYDGLADRKKETEPEKNDLHKALRILARKFPKIKVRAFYARFSDSKQESIVFEEVSSSTPQNGV
jgi:hypothetical protein